MPAVNLPQTLKLLTLALLAMIPLTSTQAAETWFKLNKNEANNAFQNQPAAVTTLTTGSQTWTSKDLNLFAGAGIVVAGGSVYTVRQEGGITWGNLADDTITLLAFSAATGGRYWESRPLAVGSAVDYWSSSTPTYDPAEDALYFGSGEYIQKINVKTGRDHQHPPDRRQHQARRRLLRNHQQLAGHRRQPDVHRNLRRLLQDRQTARRAE
jgi:hypothetical protein